MFAVVVRILKLLGGNQHEIKRNNNYAYNLISNANWMKRLGKYGRAGERMEVQKKEIYYTV